MFKKFLSIGLCCGVIFIAVLALIGHISGRGVLYNWSGNTLGMPVNGACCFILISVAFILMLLEKK